MKLITILVCKALCFAGRLLGRGTSLPGAIALKLCPDILSRIRLPENVIAVTGSNGKTSTVEMIAKVLTDAGKQVVWNKEGSNQIEGVATLLLGKASLSGKVKGDIVLLESDERFARLTFRHVKPTVFVVTNLYRDQLTRNGHPFLIRDAIQDAVDLIPGAKLVLNADDPIVRSFGLGREDVVWFGMDRNGHSRPETDAVYNDCTFCPCCGGAMEYDYFHYAHLGKYRCPVCGYDRPETEYAVTAMDLENRAIEINGSPIALEFASQYNVYNLCAAYAAAALMGVPGDKTAAVLSEFVQRNGRIVRFMAGEKEGLLITSKHENSTSYNQSLAYVASRKEPCELIVLVDAVSRKYYTAETSWLWDISFEMLKGSKVEKIWLTGKYAYDLGLRFEFSGLDDMEIVVEPDMDAMARGIREEAGRTLYAVTCFSDKDKLFDRVRVLAPGK